MRPSFAFLFFFTSHLFSFYCYFLKQVYFFCLPFFCPSFFFSLSSDIAYITMNEHFMDQKSKFLFFWPSSILVRSGVAFFQVDTLHRTKYQPSYQTRKVQVFYLAYNEIKLMPFFQSQFFNFLYVYFLPKKFEGTSILEKWLTFFPGLEEKLDLPTGFDHFKKVCLPVKNATPFVWSTFEKKVLRF